MNGNVGIKKEYGDSMGMLGMSQCGNQGMRECLNEGMWE